MKIKAENDIELVNEEVTEILGSPPKWIVRWGSAFLLFFIGLLITVSLLIKQYEIVYGRVEITSTIQAIPIFAPYGSKIDSVFVNDEQAVKTGSPLLGINYLGYSSIIRAKHSGYVSFQKFLLANALVNTDSLLMQIEPLKQIYNASMVIPKIDFIKVKLGQSISITPEGFPKQEFGNLVGVVVTKPKEYKSDSSIFSIQLTNNGYSTFHKRLNLGATSIASGEIIVNKKSLFSALLGL